MNDYNNNSWDDLQERFAASGAASAFMKQVYAIMTLGLAITGMTSWFIGSRPELMYAIFSGAGMFIVFLPIVFVLALSFGIEKMSYTVASLVFALYSLVNGVSLSIIFAIYQLGSIAYVFFITTGMFGTMAIIGMTTKVDLSKFSSILMMGLVGIILAGIANIWLGSDMLSFGIAVIGVVIFCGLTAYDSQRIMEFGMNADTENEGVRKAALMGALTLYLDFINLFLKLLRLLGRRK